MSRKKLLVIDDDTRLRNLLGKFLGENGFEIDLAKDTLEAREFLAQSDFDLLIVDVMMPGENGIDFTDFFKKQSNVPVLILTARGEPDDRIKGLEVGADDYLAKPFEPKELLLRINNILRRGALNGATNSLNNIAVGATNSVDEKNSAKNNFCNFGDFSFDFAKSHLKKGEKFMHLTESEAKILAILCQHKNSALSRDQLAVLCGNIDSRSIDVQITRLRRKIEDNPKQPEFLQTVRNQGYVLRG